MSPHAISQQSVDSHDDVPQLLREFQVSGNGFLPLKAPLRRLSDPYYEPWELVVHDLASLLKIALLRHRIDDMSILSTAHLRSDAEYRRAYSILGFLAHSYIWGGDRASEVTRALKPIVVNYRAYSLVTGPPSADCSASDGGLFTSRVTASGYLRWSKPVEF